MIGIKTLPDVIHQYIRFQNAKSRQGSHKTKTRSEVSGRSKKPFSQKGTGNARQGSSKPPHFRGGATSMGPVNRDHSISLNKKEKALALKSALSSKMSENNIIFIDSFVIEKNGDMGMTLLGSNSAGCFIAFGDDGDNDAGRIGYDHNTNRLTMKVNGTDYFRYHSTGRFSIGTTSSTHTIHTVDNIAGNYVAHFDNENNSGSHPYGLKINFSGMAPDDNVAQAIIFADSSAQRFIVFSDGDVQNHDNSYGSISDEKVKEQITDASSQWNDIKALKVRKFKMKEDVAKGDSDDHWRLGVVAQELETAGMSGLVKNNPDMEEDTDTKIMKETGTTTKSVKYSILYMKAVKALQEAMTKIETLETEVNSLKSRVTTLES